jgi:hypothetical protein
MFFNSAPGAGALQRSADGSQFSVYLDTPINIPRAAQSITVSCTQAAIWYTTPNISAQFGNNIFAFTVGGGFHQLTIPDGLYSVADLSSYIATSCVNLGLPANSISLTGNASTGQLLITIAVAGDSVDLTSPNSVRTVLGFDAGIYTAPSNGYTFAGQNPAAFNRVNQFLITSNLLSTGLPINNFGQGVVASVAISAAPGSQIQYAPPRPIKIAAGELAGTSRSNFQFTLVDQLLRPVPTAGEFYTFVLLFEYYL